MKRLDLSSRWIIFPKMGIGAIWSSQNDEKRSEVGCRLQGVGACKNAGRTCSGDNRRMHGGQSHHAKSENDCDSAAASSIPPGPTSDLHFR